MNLRPITKLSRDRLQGRKVILRLDLNLPLKSNQPADLWRLKRSLPVLRFLRSAGARTLIISHLGRDGDSSLKPVVQELNRWSRVGFAPDLPTAMAMFDQLPRGGLLAAENIRREKGELANDRLWAKKLAAAADLYVNDAFSVCHREHASIVQLPKFLPGYAGPALLDEVKNLSRILRPRRPFVVVLGGAKFSTKLPLLNKLLRSADQIMVGGALAHIFFQQKGLAVGRSFVDVALKLPATTVNSRKILLPLDVVVKNELGASAARQVGKVLSTDTIMDLGPNTLNFWLPLIGRSKLFLWNGPLGYFEEGFGAATARLAKAVGRGGAFSVVGGGDTVAAIAAPPLLAKFDFVSAAGGAMLEFLVRGTLPGLKALE